MRRVHASGVPYSPAIDLFAISQKSQISVYMKTPYPGGVFTPLGPRQYPPPQFRGSEKNFLPKTKNNRGDPYVFILGGLRFFERAKNQQGGFFILSYFGLKKYPPRSRDRSQV